jgi:hypothetical protein
MNGSIRSPRFHSVLALLAIRPRPNFSLSEKSFGRQNGRLCEILRRLVVNVPSLGENEAKDRGSALVALFHGALFAFVLLGIRIGEGPRLMPLVGVLRPGLDHPPPRAGDGDRESDMPSKRGALGDVAEVPLARDFRSFTDGSGMSRSSGG